MDFRAIRDLTGMDQEGFAEEMGVSRQTYSKYESGKANKNRPEFRRLEDKARKFVSINYPSVDFKFYSDCKNKVKDKEKILALSRSLSLLANNLIECLEDK